jgi:hypothetical protein
MSFRNTLKLSNNENDSLLVQNQKDKDVTISASSEKKINFNAKAVSFKNNQGLVISDVVSEFFDMKNSIDLQRNRIDVFLEEITNDSSVNTLTELIMKINNENQQLSTRIENIANVLNELTNTNNLE